MDTNEIKSRLVQFGTDMKDTAGKLTKNAVDSSRKVSERFQIQGRIRKAEARLDGIYRTIGKKYEELYGSKNDPEFGQFMAEIADARAQIASARAELSSLDSAAVCGKCGKFVTENQNFCPYCGTKIIRNSAVETEIISSETEEYENF